MKAAIVTFVRAYNYGAVLQCYALSRKMQELGYHTEVLDYYPDYFRKQYNMSAVTLRSLSSRPNKMWLVYVFLRMTLNRRNRGFVSFIKRYIPVSEKQYRTMEEIDAEELSYDAYVSGSDQVWSCACVPFDPVYFLRFSSADCRRKYAYAASFGLSALPENLKKEYKERLRGWDGYSVRENSGAKILEDLLGAQAVQSCDPTMLLSDREWDTVRKKNIRRKPFILIYRVNGDTELLDFGAKLAREKDMDVISLSSMMRYENIVGFDERNRGFVHRGAASPDEWLGLFAEAEYVLTDSFHGTVFSIIYHRKFISQCVTPWSKNIRVQELLNLLQLKDRVFSGDIYSIEREVDWDFVDWKMQEIREASMTYLRDLEGARDG